MYCFLSCKYKYAKEIERNIGPLIGQPSICLISLLFLEKVHLLVSRIFIGFIKGYGWPL